MLPPLVFRAGIYGGMGADLVSAFVKKGLTFWSRDLFVLAFMTMVGAQK